MKVIINADDFGINPIVTSEIGRMIEIGAISSTTIMANGSCLDEVKKIAFLHPEISYGVHLCLSEFTSITKSPILYKYGITDKDGVFITKAIFKVRSFNDELKSAIKNELCAQIQLVKSLGIPLSHCDSHHHVHNIFPLKEVFAQALLQCGFLKIRKVLSFDTLRSKLHLILWVKNMMLDRFYTERFESVNYFCSYLYFVTHNIDYHIVELMCHPGHPGIIYKNEMVSVEQKLVLSKAREVQIISYNEL